MGKNFGFILSEEKPVEAKSRGSWDSVLRS